MKLFLDTADVNDISELAATGLVDGITTNPSLAAKTGRPFIEALKEICDLVPGSISAEVTALKAADMIDEGKKLSRVAPNVTIKVPLTWDGLKACRALTGDGHKVNVTLCFSPVQALLAAKAAPLLFRPSSAASTMPATTAWRWFARSATSTTVTAIRRRFSRHRFGT